MGFIRFYGLLGVYGYEVYKVLRFVWGLYGYEVYKVLRFVWGLYG